ncbi:cytochrome c3 family protein, partial [Sutterella wadsworthensis]
QTAKVEPNPHYSHLGDVNCTDCHKGHKKSELMCNSCHQFDLKVPH